MKTYTLHTILFFLFFIAQNICVAQDTGSNYPKWVAYADVGTNIFISSTTASVEYHLYSTTTDKLHIAARVGLGAAAVFYSWAGPGAKLAGTMITGKKNNHFEAQLGVFLGADTNYQNEFFALPVALIGYRYQKPTGGFVFRVFGGVTGLGLGFGWAF